jgi:hypothetical protein
VRFPDETVYGTVTIEGAGLFEIVLRRAGAPLDVERLAEACEATALPYFEVQGFDGWTEATPDWVTFATNVAAEYAALRYPDTETDR